MKQRTYPCRLVPPLLVSAILVATAVPVAAETEPAVLDRSVIALRILAPDVMKARQQLDASFDDGNINWIAVEAVLAQRDLDDVAREFLLYGVLTRIRIFEPDTQAERFVERLLTYDSKTYVMHEEGPLPITVYPIADAARGTLAAWHRRSVERQTTAALSAGDVRSLEALQAPGTDEYRAVLDALQNANTLATARAGEWLAANADSSDYYEARVVVALKTYDAARTSELLEFGRGPEAVRLLKAVRTHFDPAVAFELLDDATRNPLLASAAVYEIDALGKAGLASQVDDYLLDTLRDKTLGATAAAVVARRGDHRLFERVADTLLAPTATRDQQARAVLALTLADSPHARRTLESAVSKGRFTDRGLQEKVTQWLQQ